MVQNLQMVENVTAELLMRTNRLEVHAVVSISWNPNGYGNLQTLKPTDWSPSSEPY